MANELLLKINVGTATAPVWQGIRATNSDKLEGFTLKQVIEKAQEEMVSGGTTAASTISQIIGLQTVLDSKADESDTLSKIAAAVASKIDFADLANYITTAQANSNYATKTALTSLAQRVTALENEDILSQQNQQGGASGGTSTPEDEEEPNATISSTPPTTGSFWLEDDEEDDDE